MLSIIAQAPPPGQRQPIHGAVEGQLTYFISISLAFGFLCAVFALTLWCWKIGYGPSSDQSITRAIDRLFVIIGCLIVLSLLGPLVMYLLPV